MKIFGTVTDQETGRPISIFRAIKVQELRPHFLSTDFQDPVQGQQGNYELPIRSHGQNRRRYFVRIEADGYRTLLSEQSVGVGDPPLRQDFALEPAPAQVGMVMNPNGKPTNKFTVAVGTPTIPSRFDLDRIDSAFSKVFRAESEYQFKLAATSEPRRVRVFSDQGFAEVLRQPGDDIGIIRLQPWASVSGTLRFKGVPLASHWVYAHPIVQPELGEPRFQDSFGVRTDQQGRFVFPHLPPMALTIHANARSDSPLTATLSQPVVLQPGDRKTIRFGEPGVQLTAHVVATGRPTPPFIANGLLIRRGPKLTLPGNAPEFEHDTEGPVKAEWIQTPGYYNWLSTRTYFSVNNPDDGRFDFSDVPPGNYDFAASFFARIDAEPSQTVGVRVVPVEVTAQNVADKTIDLGLIEIDCKDETPDRDGR